MDTIKTISTYDSAYDVIETHMPEFMETLTEHQKTLLLSSDDFENFAYIVINNNIVIVADGCNGDVISRYDNMRFFCDVSETYLENMLDE